MPEAAVADLSRVIHSQITAICMTIRSFLAFSVVGLSFQLVFEAGVPFFLPHAIRSSTEVSQTARALFLPQESAKATSQRM